jgi:hypothetical protein
MPVLAISGGFIVVLGRVADARRLDRAVLGQWFNLLIGKNLPIGKIPRAKPVPAFGGLACSTMVR